VELHRLQTKGRCYRCGKQGHLQWDCLDKLKGAGNPPSYASKARSTELPHKEEEEHRSTLEEIARTASMMDWDQKLNYLNGFLLKLQNF
jgi:hypothetical protein